MSLHRGDLVWLKNDVEINLGKNVQDIHRIFVVISNNSNNTHAPTVNIASLTKQVSKSNYPMHVFLDKEKYKLKYNSIVLAEQVFTVNKSKISEVVGRLDEEDLKKLDKAIYVQFINEKDIVNF